MPLQKISSQIKSSAIAPFYYFYGEEKYLMDKAVAMLTESVMKDGLGDFNVDRMSLAGNSVEDILASAYQLPMMSAKRLIIVKDAEKLKESDHKRLLEYIAAPVESTCIIFVSGGEKVDRRLKFFAQFAKKGEIFEFKPLYENKLPYFIKSEAKELDKMIADDAVNLLIQFVGNNLGELEAEMKKISIGIGSKKLISRKDVEEYSSDTRKSTVFELADSLGARDVRKSLKILRNMLEHGEYPVAILGAVIRHFNNLFEIREKLDRKEKKEDIAKSMGIHPFFIGKYMDQAKRLKRKDIKSVFDSLLLTDIALKSRKLPDRLILEKLFFDLCL